MKQWVCETVLGLFPKRDKGVSHDCFISKHCFKMKQSDTAVKKNITDRVPGTEVISVWGVLSPILFRFETVI